jgi:hypothetical protein
MALLKDLAQVIKTKNAGPFQLTIDIVFEDAAVYHRVKQSGIVDAALFARLYKTAVEDVLFTPYDAANAFKATLPRRIPSGDPGDSDVYGAQQHAPLLDLQLPF